MKSRYEFGVLVGEVNTRGCQKLTTKQISVIVKSCHCVIDCIHCNTTTEQKKSKIKHSTSLNQQAHDNNKKKNSNNGNRRVERKVTEKCRNSKPKWWQSKDARLNESRLCRGRTESAANISRTMGARVADGAGSHERSDNMSFWRDDDRRRLSG